MASRSARKGARGELEVVELFRAAGFLQAQRAARGAALDRGDIAGIPDLTVEVKNHTNLTEAIQVGLADLTVEQANNHTPWGVLFAKRRMKGWIAVMPAEQFIALWASREED